MLNKKMEDFRKKDKYLEDSGLLVKDVTQTIENETKEQKSGFLKMLLATLGASSLGNMLAGKGVIKVDDGVRRAGRDF